MSDIQRRRPTADDSKPMIAENKEEVKYSKMKTVFWNRRYIKRYALLFIGFFILFKIWQLLHEKPNMDSYMSPEGMEAGWKYSANPQGTNEKELNQILEKISQDQDVQSARPMSAEGTSSLKLPKVKTPYASSGSLKFRNKNFYLDGKPLKIMSGAMHYFRVMPNVWRDRMLQMKACGLNTLETYVPWNLHEEYPGEFNFKGILDIRKYIQMAQEIGLYVILRPGPYICSEWDFGGLPAWLLKDKNMKVRSSYPGYENAVKRYWSRLIPLVADLQHMKGGPIIAVQVENEFGSYSSEVEHLLFLKKLLILNGITEMLFTSDGMVNSTTSGFQVAPFYDEALPTANFKDYRKGTYVLDAIEKISSDFPLFVMEFWSGWFEHWEKAHARSTTLEMATDLQFILRRGASVNFYMFHGGTNFGFTAGANWFAESSYKPDITSYDYIAPLSEAGDTTPKYEVARAMIMKYVLQPEGLPSPPEPAPNKHKANYGLLKIDSYLTLESILNAVKYIKSGNPVSMEMLNLHEGYGQNFGYIVYRAYIRRGKQISFQAPGADWAQIMVNNVQISLKNWHSSWSPVDIPPSKLSDENILDILVENHGRVNYVKQGYNRFNEERKGINGAVYLDDKVIEGWKIYPLEFKQPFIDKVTESPQWKIFANWDGNCALFRGNLQIHSTPEDTFLNMKGWEKGIVLINGFNLGRYWKVGPQETLYVPASILHPGDNQVLIFEQLKPSHSVIFQSTPTVF